MLLATWGLPALATAMGAALGLPFILNNMLAALIIGAIVGQGQYWLLKRLGQPISERWMSQTAVSAVLGVFFVGFFSVFLTDLSSLSGVLVRLPVGLGLVVVGIEQAFLLRRTGHLPSFVLAFSWVWLHGLLAAVAASGMWWALPVVLPLTAILLLSQQAAQDPRKSKAATDTYDNDSEETALANLQLENSDDASQAGIIDDSEATYVEENTVRIS